MIKMRGGIPALLLRLICEGSNQNPLKEPKGSIFLCGCKNFRNCWINVEFSGNLTDFFYCHVIIWLCHGGYKYDKRKTICKMGWR